MTGAGPRTGRGASAVRAAVAPVLLAGVWVVLWGTYDVGSVVFGAVIALVVLALFPMPELSLGVRARPWALARLVGRFGVDLVVSSVQVAYRSVLPGWHPRGAVVRVDLVTDDDLLAVVTAELVGLVPGTVVIELDRDRHELLLHVFDVRSRADLDDAAKMVRAQERRVLDAFGPPRVREGAENTKGKS